jgi:predicted aconitase
MLRIKVISHYIYTIFNSDIMYLTREQEQILDGEKGEMLQRMFRLLTRLGDIYNADKMIPIGSVQVAGVSYKSIGDPGLEFLEDLAHKGARVQVLTFLNPAGMDLEEWENLGFPQDFSTKQLRIITAFKEMGIVPTATCTPYLIGNLPRFGEHLAWSESSAVSFANSVIGARTNREGGPSALAAALCGLTPNYGLHLFENRLPEVIVEVKAQINTLADFGALGHLVGKNVRNKVPYFNGISDATTDHLKSLGAAMAASGAVALYHIQGITPESQLMDVKGLETIHVTQKDINETYELLNQGSNPDIIIFGCPHSSLREIIDIAKKVEGKKLKKPVWICTSRAMKEIIDRMGLTSIIEKAGGKLVADTCMVVSPLEKMGYSTTAVNSGKAAQYLPGFCKQDVVYKKIDDLLEDIIA